MTNREKATGVYATSLKDGTQSFRASVTYKSKHISLGSYSSFQCANEVYIEADALLKADVRYEVAEYDRTEHRLPFSKWVALLNFKNNGIYCRGPIYLRERYFEYYLDHDTVLYFDVSELFYYSHHTIQHRGGHLFVADYGSQLSVLARYGIKPFSVPGRDYYFVNGNPHDLRAGNIVVVNRFIGVSKETSHGRDTFVTKIHLVGDLIVGRYENETDAAIAYNKAADILEAGGAKREFNRNYIEEISSTEYKLRYERIKVSRGIRLRRGI